jgi:hypothetical protein
VIHPHQAVTNATVPILEVGKESDAWAETWEESDDWEHRAGDEDKKADHTYLGNSWGTNPIIRVSS